MEFKAFFVLVLLIFLFVPVHAGEINPSVESQPFFCRYSLTDWTPLCVQGGTGSGSTSINAENNTYFYNSTSNETYVFSNETSLFNITIGNNLTTISNYTYFTLVNITYSEMNQTPGPEGPQGVNGTPGIDGYTPVFGVDYFNGSDGAPGYTPIFGVDYFNGSDGAQGPQGEQGIQGIQGDPGPAGADGAANMTAGPQGIQGEKGDKGDKGDTGDAGPMNMTPNMTAGPEGPMNQTVLDISWNTSYQTIANQSAYDIAVNTSMKDYVDFGHVPILFRATNGSVDQGGIASPTQLKFTTEVYDTGGYYNASISRFTPGVAGYYFFHTSVRIKTTTADRRITTTINKNGAIYADYSTIAHGGTRYPGCQVSAIVYLNGTGDYVDTYFDTDDTARTIFHLNGLYSYFEGYKL